MEKLSLNIAAEKNCTVKSYSNLIAVFTWTAGLQLGWKIYLHICSQSVLCILRVMIRQNLLRLEELSGDFVTTTHETCMMHCSDGFTTQFQC
jgi:hypothetical protein